MKTDKTVKTVKILGITVKKTTWVSTFSEDKPNNIGFGKDKK